MTTMNPLALVANTKHAWPSRAELDALDVNGVRSICYDDDSFEAGLNEVPDGVKVVALLNSEHEDVGPGYENWSSAVLSFAARFEGRVHAVECGNELDLLGLTPEFGAKLVRDAAPYLQGAGMAALLSSVAGPSWPEWLARATSLSRGWYDGVCLHPYGQSPSREGRWDGWGFGYLEDAINTAHAMADAPVWLTEWGVKIGDAGGEAQQAEYLMRGAETIRSLGSDVVPFAAYFAWTDIVGGPDERGDAAFGLRDVQMRARPAWDAFAVASRLGRVAEEVPMSTSVWGGDPPPNAIFQLGFLEWATKEPTLIGQPHDVAEFGVSPGISQQRSTRGLLTWAQLRVGQVTTFLDATNGKRYVWNGIRSNEVKVR